MYIYHCFHSYDWEETLVFTVIGLYRLIYGPCIHQCISFACTFVNLPESVKIFTGNSLVILIIDLARTVNVVMADTLQILKFRVAQTCECIVC